MTSTLAPIASSLGDSESGQDIRSSNVAAVQAVANVIKTSLGPQGLDKMLVDPVGEVTISNDGATILKLIEVQHPAARVLVDLSQLQDQEVGDGTTSVVLLAAELLKRANQLVKTGIHPTAIIAGYKLALKESVQYIKSELTTQIHALGKDILLKIAKTTLSSKYLGAKEDYFANLVVDAILSVKTTVDKVTKYPVNSVNIITCHGKSALESYLHNGYVLGRTSRASMAMPNVITNARIALLDFNLRQHRMQLGVRIEVTDPDELEKIREKERDITKNKIKKILNAGANVILTTQGIDEMALKYFVEAKAIAVRRVKRKDMLRIAKCTGATMCLSMATLEGDEEFLPSWLGSCKEVHESRVGDWDFLFFEGCKNAQISSLILRGPNETFLGESERSLYDALCTVSRALEHNSICAGGGAVEAALAAYLDEFARTLGSREQMAVAEFAESMLIIPKTLAANAGLDILEIISKLKWYHNNNKTNKSDNDSTKWIGLDLMNNNVRNNLEAGVIEPSISKIKAIRFATEAAVTLLRIDDVIRPQIEPPAPEAQRQ